ncbi:hypothetical protein TrLO_g12049 [Triparma laevis f. longispina]|uniref:Uncharacterized protein n=1 Tax=Triparma laevis f. longispina TaxID=1714387 RepID=A0A9W7ECJ7_9STRA|nr:hypothetical protein TrLO_g12049 [Triparma laevis f. longispina]
MWGCDGGDCDVCGSDPIVDASLQYVTTKIKGRCNNHGLIQVDDTWSTCEDVIGRGLMSCETDLCDECDWAGYCDKACGICKDVKGGDEDEGGTCSEEVGGERGGEEVGEEEDEDNNTNSNNDYCILLTAAICPAQDMTHTVRKQPMLRLREYEKVVKQYASLSKEWTERGSRPPSVVFVENSGSNLTSLRKLSQNAPNIEFLSWHDVHKTPVSRGKGIFEYRSIQYGVDNSFKIKKCNNVIKVTGRYFVKSLFDEIERLKNEKEYKLVVQSTENFWNMHENDGGIIRSEVVGFDKGVAGWLFRGQNEALGLPMERILRLLGYFGAMGIDSTRNAEGVLIEFL